ncbi:lactonase family protein [Arthrobacter sp. ISL-48]|uniref:lactonase family protein n=1 Tax=Arthrobacter sp. ISL-48 TaxID=2819110 RepID=UPI001BEBCEE6|nr:lactonase family protein [Arthrobacter sp. ISL-48]MBT2532383.1 lactonase family protein [Arthrobacter sp. ISL-48]
MNAPQLAYVGSRTTPERGTGAGISSFIITDGRWTLLEETPAVNPGFLVFDPVSEVLHAAAGDHDYITSYRAESDGKLQELGRQPTLGTNPAHICLDPSGRYVLAANHTSGSVVSLPILPDGTLGPVTGRLKFTGDPGPHRTDQTGAKPHQVVFSPAGDYFLVPDKGLDTIFTGTLDTETGGLELTGSLRLREFSGPRHLVFHPHHALAYAINELNSTVTVLDCSSPENLRAVQYLPTVEDSDIRDSRAAEVVISADGRFLYAGNRSGAGDKTAGGPGDDTIAVYGVKEDGRLSPASWTPSGGIRPRFITLSGDGTTLYAANEKSNSIDAIEIDMDSGLPRSGRRVVQTGSPVCIVFAPGVAE